MLLCFHRIEYSAKRAIQTKKRQRGNIYAVNIIPAQLSGVCFAGTKVDSGSVYTVKGVEIQLIKG